MEVYTVNELAQVMGVSNQTVISWMENHQIPLKVMTAEGTFIKSIIDPLIAIYKNTPPSEPQSNQHTQTMPAKKAKKKAVTKQGFPAEAREQAMILLFEEQLTMKDVAAQIGCSINTIQSWKKNYKQAETKAEPEVPASKKIVKKAVKPKTTKPQPTKAVASPQIAFDDFVRNYWNEGSKAVDVLLLPPEISQMVSRYVNEALRYGYERFCK